MCKQKVNIIYLTTRCNLDCTYCYERDKRNEEDFEHKDITIEQINDYVNDLEESEKHIKSTTVVVMGGEPTLMYDKLEYLLGLLSESGKSLEKGYYITFTTNGLLFDDEEYRNKIIELFANYNKDSSGVNITLEISYDGVGHKLRQYKNGDDSTLIVEGVLDTLNKMEYNFFISYTVTNENYDKLVSEVIRIYEKYEYCDKISLSFAYRIIDDELGYGSCTDIQKQYRPIMRTLYDKYKKPICDLACGIKSQKTGCFCCNKQDFDGNKYMSPTTGVTLKKKQEETIFNQF